MKKLLSLFFILAICCQAIAQNLTYISGVIANTNSQPVAGATVALLNTNYTTVTNAKGEFRINNIPQGTYTLHITSAAYAERSQVITLSGKGQPINIKLQSAGKQLDEVVITAQKREEQLQQVPISVSTLSANDVQAYHLQNLKEITGIVPNLYSAGPGDNRNVTGLRGIATTSYDPAVVTYIDGVNQFSL
ncbi:MAG: carboxypeptidase-like regulatory domain-containing protein, partial [Mucilaginibacter sp.]